MKKIVVSSLFILVSLCMFAQSSIEGIWYNSSKSGKVKIFKSGDKYYGNIVWLEEPISDKTGKAKVDENNPNEAKQNAPIIGLQVLKSFIMEGPGKFSEGTIYDPENGKTYKSKMTLVDENNLDVRGYIGVPALGRTENWTRATK